MSKSWFVVAYRDGVQIVPQLWLEGDQCYWPEELENKLDGQKLYRKAVKNYHPAQKKTWPKHDVKILGVYDTFEKAASKLKIAEVQSDLNTDTESCKKSRSSRKKKVMSSEEEEGSDEEIADGIKPFPKIHQKIVKAHLPIESKMRSNSQLDTNYSQSSSRSTNGSRESSSSPLDEFPPVNEYQSRDADPPTKKKDCCNCCCKFDKEYKQNIAKQLSGMEIKLKFVLQILRQRAPQIAIVEDEDSNEYYAALPMKSEEDIEKWERHLLDNQDQDAQKKMISFLARIGGHDVNTIVKNMLKKLLTDGQASFYNWEGKKNKKMFSSLAICDCIKKAAVKSPNAPKTATEQDVIAAVKNWLRHAPARQSNSQKKK